MGIENIALLAIKAIANNPDLLKNMPNIPFPTMGGHVFWNTIASDKGWKLQQNQITHHVRILDPDNIRHGWGTEEEMQKLLNKIIK